MCLHFLVPFFKAKEVCPPKDAFMYLTVIRENAILGVLSYERGFHDGNVWGPFSFAITLLLFVFHQI